jgi:hypothetical protein
MMETFACSGQKWVSTREGLMAEESVRTTIWEWIKPVLLTSALISAILVTAISASFLLWGELTASALGDRLFLGGLLVLVGGGIGLASGQGESQTIVTGRIHDARIAQERVLAYFRNNDKRLRWFVRSSAVATVLLTIGVLLNILSG